MVYRGSCHCGAVRFTFESEEIKSGKRCNCSICSRKGALMSVPYFENLTIEGQASLTLYQWGDHEVSNWFCKRCGIYPFHEVTKDPGKYRVNLGCVEGIDPLALPYELVDGKAF